MSTNPQYKPSEGKREEFRKYLEKNGVLDALTKVLVNLYEEADKPENALEFIRDKLAVQAGLETFKQVQEKYEDYLNRIKELETEIEQLKGAEVKEEVAVAVEAPIVESGEGEGEPTEPEPPVETEEPPEEAPQ